MKKVLITLFLILAFVCIPVSAQQARRSYLSAESITRFLRDFPVIFTEIDEMNLPGNGELPDFDEDAIARTPFIELPGVQDFLDGIEASPAVMGILESHGWNISFFEHYLIVMQGYLVFSMEQSLAGQIGDYDTFIAGIRSSGDYDEATIESLAGFYTNAVTLIRNMRNGLSESDWKLILERESQIQVLFDSM